jgi:hypothetical protein
VASFGLAAPICSVCYDFNRPQVGCRAVLLAGLGIGLLVAAIALSEKGGPVLCLAPLGLLTLLGGAALAWSAFRRFP